MELWRELQPKLHLEEVVLHGGSLEDECPMEDEEFAVLFPSGSLSSLRSLHLCNVAKLTDRGFATLAQAGCGKSLTSLRVDGLWGHSCLLCPVCVRERGVSSFFFFFGSFCWNWIFNPFFLCEVEGGLLRELYLYK